MKRDQTIMDSYGSGMSGNNTGLNDAGRSLQIPHTIPSLIANSSSVDRPRGSSNISSTQIEDAAYAARMLGLYDTLMEGGGQVQQQQQQSTSFRMDQLSPSNSDVRAR